MHLCFSLEAREGDTAAAAAAAATAAAVVTERKVAPRKADFDILYVRAWRRFPDVDKRAAPGMGREGPATASQQRLLFDSGHNAAVDTGRNKLQ